MTDVIETRPHNAVSVSVKAMPISLKRPVK